MGYESLVNDACWHVCCTTQEYAVIQHSPPPALPLCEYIWQEAADRSLNAAADTCAHSKVARISAGELLQVTHALFWRC